jgi:hypothetical protein
VGFDIAITTRQSEFQKIVEEIQQQSKMSYATAATAQIRSIFQQDREMQIWNATCHRYWNNSRALDTP